MIGGGFLGQMNETLKKNREILRAALRMEKRVNFDNGEYKRSGNIIPPEQKKLSDKDRAILITRVKHSGKLELKRKIAALALSLLIFWILIWGLPMLMNFLYR